MRWMLLLIVRYSLQFLLSNVSTGANLVVGDSRFVFFFFFFPQIKEEMPNLNSAFPNQSSSNFQTEKFALKF